MSKPVEVRSDEYLQGYFEGMKSQDSDGVATVGILFWTGLVAVFWFFIGMGIGAWL